MILLAFNGNSARNSYFPSDILNFDIGIRDVRSDPKYESESDTIRSEVGSGRISLDLFGFGSYSYFDCSDQIGSALKSYIRSELSFL